MANKYDLKRWAGNVYAAELDDSDNDVRGERSLGHCIVATMAAPSVEETTEKGRGLDNYDTVIYSESGGLEQEVQITTRSDNPKNLAIAMFGEVTTTTQTAGSDTPAIDMTMYHDEYSAPADLKRKLDPATPPVVQDSTEVTTYVEGTDYEVDYATGRIMALSTGSITDLEAVKVTRTWLEAEVTAVEANRNMSKNFRLRIVGQDQIDKVYGEWQIDKCTLRPSGDKNKINEPGAGNFAEHAITGKIITVDGKQWREIRYS